VIEAQKLEDRLAYAHKAGGFLVLTVEPRLAHPSKPSCCAASAASA
jgi:hypothetical protein